VRSESDGLTLRGKIPNVYHRFNKQYHMVQVMKVIAVLLFMFLICLIVGHTRCVAEDSIEATARARVRELHGRIEPNAGGPIRSVDVSARAVTDQDMKLLAQLPQLREVNISRTAVSARGLECLLENRQFEVLAVEGLDITDRDLQLMGKSLNLVELNVASNYRMSGAGFRGMVFPKMERLNLGEPEIRRHSLKYLHVAFPWLVELRLDGAVIPIEACSDISRIETLQKLDLSISNVTDRHMARLAGLSRLESLKLRETSVSDAGLRWLAGATNLQELWADDSRITGEALRCFPELRLLSLGGDDVNDSSINYILECQKLKTLYLDGPGVSEAGFLALCRHRTVTHLNLFDFDFTNTGLAALWKMHQLEVLHIYGRQTPDAGLSGIHELANLQRLNIWRSALTASDIENIALLPKLQVLELGESKLSDSLVPSLMKLRRIPDIKMDLHDISNEQLQKLREAIPQLAE
jgi:Leucine-rich repeat (LRR) protein